MGCRSGYSAGCSAGRSPRTARAMPDVTPNTALKGTFTVRPSDHLVDTPCSPTALPNRLQLHLGSSTQAAQAACAEALFEATPRAEVAQLETKATRSRQLLIMAGTERVRVGRSQNYACSGLGSPLHRALAHMPPALCHPGVPVSQTLAGHMWHRYRNQRPLPLLVPVLVAKTAVPYPPVKPTWCQLPARSLGAPCEARGPGRRSD